MLISIMVKPTARPISGARIMKTPILTSPEAMRPPKPALATPARAKPPMSACEDDVGSPQYHVIRSQAMAPTSPARITHWSTTLASTTPLPTVVATWTPKPKAATKLKKAAHTTACSGVRTRVETTVAMELAASWKPLMKSKISATMTMRMTTESTGETSGHLEDDSLDHVGHVLTAVGDRLQRLVDFLPLDDLDGVGLGVEQLGQALAQHPVGGVLQAIDLHRVLVEAGVHRAQALDGAVHGVHDVHDHVGHGPGGRGRLLDPVDPHPLGHRLDEVQHVVQPGGEVVDVLAVDRRDERGVQPLDDLVGDDVAGVLDLLDRVGLGPGVGEIVELLAQQLGRLDDVLRLLIEQVEEADLTRDQVEHGHPECNGKVINPPAEAPRRSALAQSQRCRGQQRAPRQRPHGLQRGRQRRRAAGQAAHEGAAPRQ